MRKVIAFCGFEQSGKSYSALRLKTTMGFEIISFADPLREIAFRTLGIDPVKGMTIYEQLKRTPLINKLTFRNILENLGSAVRLYDEDFWAKAALAKINRTVKNVCINDLRYKNEYKVVKEFCDNNKVSFKLIFCDYHSEGYKDNNTHESAKLARYLKDIGYEDQQIVSDGDMEMYGGR